MKKLLIKDTKRNLYIAEDSKDYYITHNISKAKSFNWATFVFDKKYILDGINKRFAHEGEWKWFKF